MTKFIKTLRNDHRIILTLLNRSKSSKLSIEERSAFLLIVKTILTEHLITEDRLLYPKLKELASDNNRAIETVDEFTVGLEKIGTLIQNFFESYENDPENIIKSSDYAKTIKLLEVRIQKEEAGLYPLYDSLIEN